MIITKITPYTKKEIEKLKEKYLVYIKTVIDINKKICSAGSNLHTDSKKILLKQGSDQHDLWGGGLDLENMIIDFNSMINIRPKQGNNSNEIQNKKTRKEFEKLMKYFFRQLYDE